ncbi:methyl-accepting chemotaxis protein [Robertmurraya korlensis]|uniref:methyl-accepting chemotaxis protein n=1 Tax=Robertmurraya korlensis TaxID=519977 RepID=UPI0020421223|nr:methyl-accepting chemotaxis protein [Robertmurraya korlensis]MCM3601925.1 methyl-accepting chemotaxis protein [Robertmurraya korlensis]
MKWIKNLKIVQKMLLLSTITLVSLLIVGISGLTQQTMTGNKLTAMYKDNLEPIQAASLLKSNAQYVQTALVELMVNRDTTRNKELVEQLEARLEMNREIREAYKSSGQEEQEVFDSIKDVVERFQVSKEKTLELALKNQNSEAYEVYVQETGPLLTELDQLYTKLIEVNGKYAEQANDENQINNRNSSIVMISIIVLSIILFVTTSWIISRSIYGPLKQMEYLMQKAKNGDLTVHSNYESRDEIGNLSKSFNEMISQIKSLIMMVRESSDQVAASSEQLMASAEETNKAAEQIAEASSIMAANGEASVKGTEVVSVSTQQMAIGISNIADSITLVSDHSNVTTEESEKGNIALKKTIDQMGSINETVQTSSSIIKDLGERSSEIEKILAVISGISDQTNLLALNAAIEAARAGEHGKGFAVVADEVRKLAEESRRSAEQITHLIHDIQSSTSNAVVSMDKCTTEVQTGLVLINDTGKSFEKILHSAADVSRQSVEVSAAVKQLSSSVEQVAIGIFDISMKTEESSSGSQTVAAGAEEQLASMEEITASAHSLAKMAEDLQAMVNTFKVYE